MVQAISLLPSFDLEANRGLKYRRKCSGVTRPRYYRGESTNRRKRSYASYSSVYDDSLDTWEVKYAYSFFNPEHVDFDNYLML